MKIFLFYLASSLFLIVGLAVFLLSNILGIFSTPGTREVAQVMISMLAGAVMFATFPVAILVKDRVSFIAGVRVLEGALIFTMLCAIVVLQIA